MDFARAKNIAQILYSDLTLKLEQLKFGSKIIVESVMLPSSQLRLVNHKNFRFGWDGNVVYFYERP